MYSTGENDCVILVEKTKVNGGCLFFWVGGGHDDDGDICVLTVL